MINEIYDELIKRYESADERVKVSDGRVGLLMKTDSPDAASIVDELLTFGKVYSDNLTGSESVLGVYVDIDEEVYGRLSDYAENNCRESQEEVFHHRMPCPGIRVYEVETKSYYLSDWRGKAYMLTRTGSNRVVIVAASVTGELHGLIKHLGSAPFVFSKSIHLMHGTSIHYRGKNIIVAAESGHGKTTFGLLFGLDEGALISEDISYITTDSMIVNTGSKNYITIRKGTLYAFRDHFGQYCTEDEVSPMELYQAGENESVRVGLDILPAYSEQGKALEPVDLCIVPVIDGAFLGYEISELTKSEIAEINAISNRDYNVDWLLPMLSFPAAVVSGTRNNCNISGVRYVRLHTGFDYRDNFNNIAGELFG